MNDQQLAAIRVKLQRAARQLNEATPEKLWTLLDILHVESREGLYRLLDLTRTQKASSRTQNESGR